MERSFIVEKPGFGVLKASRVVSLVLGIVVWLGCFCMCSYIIEEERERNRKTLI